MRICEDKSEVKKISYSFGVVDLFHYGHLKGIIEASKDADITIFGLVSEKAARAWIGNVVSSEKERRAVLESNKYIDYVIIQDSFDPTDNIKRIHKEYPQAQITLFHGDDIMLYPSEMYLKEIGGKVEIFDYYDNLSPKNIIESLGKKNEEKEYTNILSTKANTLKSLSSRVKLSHIEKLTIVTVEEVNSNFDDVYEKIKNNHKDHNIIIRSSSKKEDSFKASNAGHFDSVLDVDVNSRSCVKSAMQRVIESYSKDEDILLDEQILIQNMTEDVDISGVIFTRDIKKNRPFYVINYDDTGTTDSVTSGSEGKILWVSRDTNIENQEFPLVWKSVLRSVKEIEEIFKNILLDIEFAVRKNGEIVIFQVRPLAASYRYGISNNDQEWLDYKNQLKDKYSNLKMKDGIMPFFSDMAFWNPAEIIGTNPHNLDYSLYRKIITHRAWNVGLRKLGYRTVGKDLMYKFGNKPYICLDYAFESLIPAEVNDSLVEKMVKYYKECLKKNPSAHDKIEFEIVISCYDFSTKKRIDRLFEYGFSNEEVKIIETELLYITNKMVLDYRDILANDLADLDKLEAQRMFIEAVIKDSRITEYDYVSQIGNMLEGIVKYGTCQFARQARCAFVAKAFCVSLVEENYISEDDYNIIMASISTVAENFNEDLIKYSKGTVSKNEIMKKYGHLRAGTYNICVLRYDQMDILDNYCCQREKDIVGKENITELLKNRDIDIKLKESKFDFTFDDFLFFISKSIEQREYFKFIFTKSLSFCLELISELGKKLSINRKDISYVGLEEILSLCNYDSIEEMQDFLKTVIQEHKMNHEKNLNMLLPSCLFCEKDFDIFGLSDVRPNFITNNSVKSEIVYLDIFNGEVDIKGKIVAIEKADPGYDWIFSKDIVGLVTKYGGVASHMAIRCAEFSIPAAIGCGEKIFNEVCLRKAIKLDCKNNVIVYI